MLHLQKIDKDSVDAKATTEDSLCGPGYQIEQEGKKLTHTQKGDSTAQFKLRNAVNKKKLVV